jgi:hypothetical protein
MTKQKKISGPSGKTGRFVVGRAGFAKISAVEGIQLTDAMKKRADDKRTKGISSEEHRRAIISSHRKG